MDKPTGRASPTAREEPKRHSILIDIAIRLVKEKPLATIGGVIVLILIFVAILADLLAPYGYEEINLFNVLAPPSAKYWLGTDSIGRDLFSRIIHGARVSLIVGFTAETLRLAVSGIIGVTSGFIGGKYDLLMQRFCDGMMCFPALFLYLAIMSIMGPGMIQVIFVLGVINGLRGSRVLRSAVMSIKENVYVEASHAVGCSTVRILWKHILPNVMAILIVSFSTGIGGMILAEATLSFLGFGIPPPIPSWGGMLSGQARKYMLVAPWLALWPGLALSLTIFGVNMLGDGIRDILDPRLRGGLGRYGGTKAKEVLAKIKREEERIRD